METKMEYFSRNPRILSNSEAPEVGRWISQLEVKLGRINPRDIVEEAKDPTAPIHDRLWGKSDEVAAYHWRESLARGILSAVGMRPVKIQIEEFDHPVKNVDIELIRTDFGNHPRTKIVREGAYEIPAFISPPNIRGKSYRKVDELSDYPEELDSFLKEGLRILRTFRDKYSQVEAFAKDRHEVKIFSKVAAAIDELIDVVENPESIVIESGQTDLDA